MIHKCKFKLFSAPGLYYNFMCNENLGVNRCGKYMVVHKSVFWGDPWMAGIIEKNKERSCP